MTKTIIGLDLAATFQKKKVGVAVVKIQGEVFTLTSVQLLRSTDEILDAVQKAELPVLLAIDAPLRLALNDKPDQLNIRNMEAQWPMLYTYRPWEYLVFEKLRKEYGISGTGNSENSIPLIFTDMLSNSWKTKKVYIKRLIALFKLALVIGKITDFIRK